jgi:hypothetical protein
MRNVIFDNDRIISLQHVIQAGIRSTQRDEYRVILYVPLSVNQVRMLECNQMRMKISLIIHGPEVIDSGEVKIVLEKLSRLGEVKAELGGTMGKTAVLDAVLENVIDISRHLKPSACIESFFETSDLVCLLNRGKTVETGMIFGAKVASRLKDLEKKPLIQIESPGSPGKTLRNLRAACRNSSLFSRFSLSGKMPENRQKLNHPRNLRCFSRRKHPCKRACNRKSPVFRNKRSLRKRFHYRNRRRRNKRAWARKAP